MALLEFIGRMLGSADVPPIEFIAVPFYILSPLVFFLVNYGVGLFAPPKIAARTKVVSYFLCTLIFFIAFYLSETNFLLPYHRLQGTGFTVFSPSQITSIRLMVIAVLSATAILVARLAGREAHKERVHKAREKPDK